MRQQMKSIMEAHIAASKPVHLNVGLVTASAPDPLEISIDQKLVLSADFLIVPESLMHLELQLQHVHSYTDSADSGTASKQTDEALPDPVIIRRGLGVGDRVLLLRVQGGQKYVVFDRVVLP